MGDLSQHGPEALSIVRHGSRLLSCFANGDDFFFAGNISDKLPSRHRHSNVTASTQQRHGLVVRMHQCTFGAFGPGFRTPSEYPAPTSYRRAAARTVYQFANRRPTLPARAWR